MSTPKDKAWPVGVGTYIPGAIPRFQLSPEDAEFADRLGRLGGSDFTRILFLLKDQTKDELRRAAALLQPGSFLSTVQGRECRLSPSEINQLAAIYTLLHALKRRVREAQGKAPEGEIESPRLSEPDLSDALEGNKGAEVFANVLIDDLVKLIKSVGLRVADLKVDEQAAAAVPPV